MNRLLLLSGMFMLLASLGCDKKKPPAPTLDEPVDMASPSESAATPPQEVIERPPFIPIPPPDYDEQRAYEKSLEKVKYDPDLHGGKGIPNYENAFEWDQSITPTIERIDTTGKLWRTEEGPGDNVLYDAPKIGAHITWTDRSGTNLLVYGEKTYEGGGGLLTAEFAVYEGSAWVVQRQFKEMVEVCDADLVLEGYVDREWSVIDLDGDGYAEVTMAWTAACTSDVSPNTHKVIIASKGKKYALRGVTQVDPGGGLIGGEYTVDPAFDKAPEGFLDHAKKVWEATAMIQKP